uniref:Uncharacterized protein n=1 Tax=Theileria annulata TaxID=5874 RepID=A0A3B0MY91_THEAN
MEGLQDVCDMIESVVDPEWSKINSVNSKAWEDEFNEYLTSILSKNREKSGKNKNPKPKDKSKSKSTKSSGVSIEGLSQDLQFKLSCDLFTLLEGIWLEGKKRIKAIEQTKLSQPLDLDELILYSNRISSTSCSPPENVNIDDPTRHYGIFPQYHFLGVPNTTQMHASRLFSLSKLENQCLPPIITFEPVSDQVLSMKIVCKNENAVIHFQTSRESNVPCPRTGNYLILKTDPAVYDKNKSYKFKKDCNPFTVHAWTTCEGFKQSNVIEVKYGTIKENNKQQFSIMLT